MRIVSLLPSATEIVSAVGAEHELVGVSHECDFPESVRRLPVLTSARIDARGTSQAIDAAVRAVIRDALSIYAVDERTLGELRARQGATRPRVVTVEWLAPIMLGGTWMPELIELAGGVAVGARAGEPAPTVTPAELAALAPDVVLVKPCGFSIDRTLEERALVDAIGRAVPQARVLVSDGNAFFNRPGPRLVESLEILAACVHPRVFADFAEKHASVIVC